MTREIKQNFLKSSCCYRWLIVLPSDVQQPAESEKKLKPFHTVTIIKHLGFLHAYEIKVSSP